MPDTAQTDSAALRGMIAGYMMSQIVSVTAALGLADLLAERVVSAAELARAAASHEGSLRRLLHALTAGGLVEEPHDGHFALTKRGALLRDGVPGSLRNLALMVGNEGCWRAWGDLRLVMRNGEPAFARLLGMPPFTYASTRPELAAAFDGYMADRTRLALDAILAAHDFARYGRIVDVGGGNGVLIGGILAAVSTAAGIVFDTPAAVAGAGRLIAEIGVAERCSIVSGDFFESVPPGGDAYILKSVLHDWDDDRAIAILANCRRAMSPRSVLLAIERLLPERIEGSDAHREITMMDLHMLVLHGGRERTTAHFAELCAAAHLELVATQPTASPFVIMEIVSARDIAAGAVAREMEGQP
jgi:hypothetical protein